MHIPRAISFPALPTIVLIMIAIGCTPFPGTPGDPQSTNTTMLRYLALGDSYTIGQSVEEGERWPVQLARMLRERGIAMGEPEIIARTGWTTDELLAGIDAAPPTGAYDLVSLLIGVNNQYRGGDASVYCSELRVLLERAVRYAGGRAERVLVLSIPDWGVTPFAAGSDRERIGREIDAFNAINRDEAGRIGAHYIDVTPVSRRAAAQPNLVAADGLHPSGSMYREWAGLVEEKVLGLGL